MQELEHVPGIKYSLAVERGRRRRMYITSAKVTRMNAIVPITIPAIIALSLVFVFEVLAGDGVWLPTLVVGVVVNVEDVDEGVLVLDVGEGVVVESST